MPVKLLWTPKARADIKNIYIHMAKEQPRSAERYFSNFRRKAELLIEHPCLGERHPEVFRTARMLVEAPYVILYETRPDAEDGIKPLGFGSREASLKQVITAAFRADAKTDRRSYQAQDTREYDHGDAPTTFQSERRSRVAVQTSKEGCTAGR